MKAVIIGVCGPSCSGKTTVCRIAPEYQRMLALSTDDYYKHDSIPRVAMPDCPEIEENWDARCALDYSAMHRDLLLYGESGDYDVILIEGFAVIVAELMPLFTHIIFISIPKDVIYSRRTARDVFVQKNPLYLSRIIYPSYVAYRQCLLLDVLGGHRDPHALSAEEIAAVDMSHVCPCTTCSTPELDMENGKELWCSSRSSILDGTVTPDALQDAFLATIEGQGVRVDRKEYGT